MSIRSGGWQRTAGDEIHGKILGVLGLGNIGSEVARIGRAFRMEVIAWSENLDPERTQCDAEGRAKQSKEELFRRSDILTIHLVLSDRTRGLLVEKSDLASMKLYSTACEHVARTDRR